MPTAADDFAAAIAHHRAGRLAAAEAICRAILAADSDHAGALQLAGVVAQERGRGAEAIAHFERALALLPESAELNYNYATTLKQQGRLDAAKARFERALAIKPDHANAHLNLGNVLLDLGRLGEAAARYERGLEIKPDSADLHCNLGLVRHYQGRMDEAQIHHERALAVDPVHARARLALCMAQLRVLYHDAADLAQRRAAYETQLRNLSDAAREPGFARELGAVIGSVQPFFLAYQGQNDRELQRLYGALVCACMAARHPAVAPAPPPPPHEKVRVGIVSGFFLYHSNWKMPIKGWLGGLDRGRFEIYLYHTGSGQDGETETAARLCHRFVRGPMAPERWRDTILGDRLHVLIYPEVGMNPVAAQLAAMRLARVQCNAWGHPQTSGYPTLDYFLSSELMEPPDGEAHYTERLVRLPNLAIHYEPIPIPSTVIERAALGLRRDATVYWCCQPLFKYLPQHDAVFPRIAAAAGDCQFVFIRSLKGGYVNELFRQRLERAFAAAGRRAGDHCVFLPYLAPDRFMAAMGLADIYLDSILWSGCNSAFESLAYDLPIVTLRGPLMRGRHSIALLAMIGVTDTVAETIDDYIAIAVRLARDKPWRDAIRRRIAANKHQAYRDRAPIAALDDFLDRAARAP